MKLYFFLTLYLFLLAGCSSTNKWQKEFLPQYQSGNIQSAVSHLEHIKLKEVPKNNFMLCKNSVWIYLNLATMQFAKGNIKEAIKNYDIALDSIDYYRQQCTIEQYGQFLIDDNQSAYTGPKYEQNLARVYFALALMASDDFQNARAILKNSEEFSQENNCPCVLSKYLFATLLEKEGDKDNSEILFKEAEHLSCTKFKRSHNKKATILVICHNGLSPFKISATKPLTGSMLRMIESTLSKSYFKYPLSTLPPIKVPLLVKNVNCTSQQTQVVIDETPQDLSTLFSIESVSQKDFNRSLPSITSRAICRYILKRSLISLKSNSTELQNLLDLIFFVNNCLIDADTRSWCTLPARIDIARFDVDEGAHQVLFKTGYKPYIAKKLTVKENQLIIVNLFNLNPNKTFIIL